jgi:hypothetical protein
MEGDAMKRFSWLLAALCAATLGCNKGSTPEPPSASNRVSQAVDDGRRVVDLHSRHVEKELDDMANDVHDAIGGVHHQFKTQAEKKAEELSEFAAEMAEDAKDRAVDMPEMVDMMFEPRQRHDTYRRDRSSSERSSTGSRGKDSRR